MTGTVMRRLSQAIPAVVSDCIAASEAVASEVGVEAMAVVEVGFGPMAEVTAVPATRA